MSRSIDFKFAISTVASGFYQGFNRPVTMGSVLSVLTLIAWIILQPDTSAAVLGQTKDALLHGFRGWFLYCLGGLLALAMILAVLPISGRLRLGQDDDRPVFSTGSWLSMMFCCGIGGGIVIYAVAEPLSHFAVNPELLAGTLEPGGEDAARAAVKYSFLHWGLSAWACYAILGLALALFSFRYNLPLTLRTVVAPLFGKRLSGPLGHLIDAFSIAAIIAGVATTMGYGVQTLSSGLNFLAGGALYREPATNLSALILALALCASVGALCVISGVGRGMKWLSNTGTIVFFGVMAYFAIHSDLGILASLAAGAFADYFTQFPALTLSVYGDTSTPLAAELAGWQTDWTIFYWTWWLAFAPFVGLFIARISRGRTIRAFILGSTITPCGVCFAWFACAGSAALGLEISSSDAVLTGLPPSEMLFRAIAYLNLSAFGQIFAWLSLALMFILATTTLASGVLAINTIAAAGDAAEKPNSHIVMWTLVTFGIIGALLAAGGTDSIRDVMVIGALPFSFIMVLAAVSIIFVLFVEAQQYRALQVLEAGTETERAEPTEETPQAFGSDLARN